MELQWPLVLFTTFIAWSCGLFAAQGVCAIRHKYPELQFSALITSFVLLVIGGIAVFFHLEHWERIFNGFGNPSSGITQELIGVVLVMVVMAAVFVTIRRKGGEGIPAALGWAMVVVSVALLVVAGHSYMMSARPMWDTWAQVISLFGAFCALGPASLIAIALVSKNGKCSLEGLVAPAVVGAAVNVLGTGIYLVALALASSEFTDIGYYYDPTEITRGMIDFVASTGVFGGNAAPYTISALVCACLALALAVFGWRKLKSSSGSKQVWKVASSLTVCLVLAGAVCLRAAFYTLGLSVYMFY